MTTHDEAGLRKALEEESAHCRELQGQLVRATAEFERFVSIAAHDLREPLRDVAAFSQLLCEANAGRLDSDPESGAFLQRIRDGAARMQLLLTDVVDYWAIGADGRQPCATSLDAVLDQALLRTHLQGAIVTRASLPRVCGDFDTLTKVLHHLIRNAIEYAGRPDPHIHISPERREREWVIAVRDDGPGIELVFQERVFGVFQRLHGKDLPGSGLGLAYCRKAIAWQGGRMWVESAPGAGSTFYFTLPIPEPEEQLPVDAGPIPEHTPPPPRG
ncbi:MAG TPA: ATP-binding protein [Terriglobales bacterium]|nr:ATP-binding protein [Terriglobales bacterium]